jgi:hypothetical protein
MKPGDYISVHFTSFFHLLKLLFKVVHISGRFASRERWDRNSEVKLATRQVNDDDEFKSAVCSDVESSIRRFI